MNRRFSVSAYRPVLFERPLRRDWVCWVTLFVWAAFMALTASRSLALVERGEALEAFDLMGRGHVSPHLVLYVVKTAGYLTVASAAIGATLAMTRLVLRRRAAGLTSWPAPTERRVLVLGAISVLLSGAGTYYYLSSLLLYPVLIVLFVIAYRRYKRSASIRGAALLGVSLAWAALLMPITSAASLLIVTITTAPGSPGTSGEPFFYAVFTPPVVVLIVCLLLAWRLHSTRSALAL